jgi:hypothetical protein
LTAALLAAGGIAGCGSSSSNTASTTVVTVTTAAAVGTSSTAAAAGTSSTASATAGATSGATGKSTAPVKPSKRNKAAVVALCKASVESQTILAAAKRATLAGLCATAVDGGSSTDRRKAAERICLGLVGVTAATPESAKKLALKDCKTNAWD